MLAPGVGQVLSELIVTEHTETADITPFDVTRFARGELALGRRDDLEMGEARTWKAGVLRSVDVATRLRTGQTTSLSSWSSDASGQSSVRTVS